MIYKWWILISVIAWTIITLKLAMRSKVVKRVTDRVVLKLPLVGDLVTKVAVARFSRTLGTLITSGVPILQALRITKETIGNEVIQNAIPKSTTASRKATPSPPRSTRPGLPADGGQHD